MQRTLLGGLILWSLLASPCLAGYVEEVQGDAPLSYWRLGESGGTTTADVMGNQTLNYNSLGAGDYGIPGAIVGDADTAVRLRDSLDSLLVTTGNAAGPFSFASGQSFSIEYWLNSTDPGNVGIVTKGYDTLAGNNRPWYLSRLFQNKVDFFLRDTAGVSKTVFSQGAVNDGQWHHVVGVYDAADAEIRLWVDGSLQDTVGGVPEAAYGANVRPLVIGRHNGNNGVLDGLIDEVAVYDYALDNADGVGGIDGMSRAYSHFRTGAGLAGVVPAVAFDVNVAGAPAQTGYAGLAGGGVFSGTGGATLTITNPYSPATGGTSRDRGTGGALAGHPRANLLRDFTFVNANSTDASDMLRLDVTQLEPNTDYRVRVYSYDHTSSGGARSVWYAGTPASTASTDPTYRLVHRNISGKPDSGSFDLIMASDAAGQLTLHGRRTATGSLLFNGMTVEKMPVMADVARVDVDNTNGNGLENSTQLGYAGLAPGISGGSVTSNGVTVTVTSDRTDSPSRYRNLVDNEMFDDFLFANAQMSVQIDGLTAGTEYQITIHSQDLWTNAGHASKWSVAGSGDTLRSEHMNNASVNTPVESWSFTTFVTAESSSLTLVGEQLNGLVFLNGIEIAQAVAAGPTAELKYDFNTAVARFSNNPDATGDTLPGFTAADLDTNGLLADGVAVTLSPLGDGATLQSRDRSTPVDAPPGLTQAQLYDDSVFAYSFVEGDGMEIEVAGLAANQPYDLTIWSFDSGSPGDRGSIWTDVTGQAPALLANYTFNGSTPPTADYDNTITGLVTSDADGVVRIQAVSSGDTIGVFLNGLQLTPVPEPSSAVLFGLGVMALAGCVLRRRGR